MVERYDVIVIGGGPAGSAAARAAAAGGGKVILLEFQPQFGGQTQLSVWAPPDIMAHPLKEAVISEVHELKLHSPHQQLTVEGDFGAILDRRAFDKLLAAEAVASGAEIGVSTVVKDLLVSDGAVKGVHAETGTAERTWSERLECEVVIDASGTQWQWSSPFLRKLLKRDWYRELLMFSGEYLMANASARQVELFFTSLLAPLGHAWVYPFGRRFAIAGIRGIRIHPDEALNEFVGRREVPSLERAVPIAKFMGQVPIEGALNPSCADGIMAVGGAAGQVYAFSGEGLRYALACGELAGKVAVDAIAERDVSGRALMEYDRRWHAKFDGELWVGQLLHSALKTSPDQRMDALLTSLADDAKLQRAFVNAFMGVKLADSLKTLFSREEVRQVFGREVVEKVLSLKTSR